MDIGALDSTSPYDVPAPAHTRPVSAPLRWLMLIDTVLVLIAGFQLFVLTSYTDRFFAWTISSPITAAFLGANYLAAVPLAYGSSQQRYWSHTRTVIFGVLAFTTLTLVATLLHLDRFHLSDPQRSAQIAAWAWLAVYVVFPLALLVITVQQIRLGGDDPLPRAPLPRWMRTVMVAQAMAMVVLGVVLFVAPQAPLWPWSLTPLTGRAIGAWLVGIGTISGQVAWENDWDRVRVALTGYALLGALQLVVVLRYANTIDWSRPLDVLYVLVLASILAVGSYGVAKSRSIPLLQ